jgi:hypothetical protein
MHVRYAYAITTALIAGGAAATMAGRSVTTPSWNSLQALGGDSVMVLS